MTRLLAAVFLAALTPAVLADGASPAAERPGNARSTVARLEARLPTAAGSERSALLDELRAAYESAAREAEAVGRTREAEGYRENLAILGRRTTAPSEAVTAAPSPVPAVPPVPLPHSEAVDDATHATEAQPAAADAKPEPEVSLESADAAFRTKNYAEAGRIYAALSKGAGLPENRRNPWAYCRMADVVKRINARPGTPAEWKAIQAEIEEIRRLSPKNWYAEYLRGLVADRSGSSTGKARSKAPVLRGAQPDDSTAPADSARPAIRPVSNREIAPTTLNATGDVGRQGAPVGNWLVWETPSFRILHSDETLAKSVARIAEATRDSQIRRWTGTAAQAAWSPRCDIYIYPSAALFAQMTGQPEPSPGFSTMGLNAGQVVARRVNLRADHPNILKAILPHEVTHVVLADLFTTKQIPRWADEGMAVLAEPDNEQELRAADLAEPLRSGRLFRVADLLTMDYPDGRYWALYYAQSVSLTRYLVETGSPAKLVEFLRAVQGSNLDSELKRHYGVDGVDDLQRRWLAHVRSRPTALTASANSATDSKAPVTAARE